MTAYDAVVIGTGSGGRIAALELARGGRRVVVVEAGRIGGECPYVACVPAKSLLLSARAGLSWAEAVDRRERAVHERDDTGSARTLTEDGVDIVRGHGRLLADAPVGDEPREHAVLVTGPAGAEVARLEAPVVVLAPGSRPVIPPVDGVGRVPTWTSDQALSAMRRPARLVILGGGAVGCELAQAFSLLGSSVTLIEAADRLLRGETSWVGAIVADALRDSGVDVRAGVEVVRAEPLVQTGARLQLSDGAVLDADRLLLAGGRRAATDGLGLDALGAHILKSGAIDVDARCRVLTGEGAGSRVVPGLFAVGDATEVSSYTHSANYQARIVAAELAGHGEDADYAAIPRAVYLDPAVYCVGLTAEQAREGGIEVVTGAFDVRDVERAMLVELSARPGERPVRGRVELVADARSGTLLGASCVGPEADSWGGELALAVRARLPVALLTAHMHAFPTWSEAIHPAARELLDQLRTSSRGASAR